MATDLSIQRVEVSFQPFLEALRGHEVVGLRSTPVSRPPAEGERS